MQVKLPTRVVFTSVSMIYAVFLTQVVESQSSCVLWAEAATAKGEWSSGSMAHGGPFVIGTSRSTMPLLCVICSATLRQTDPLALTPLALERTLLCTPTYTAEVQSSLLRIAPTSTTAVHSPTEQEYSVQMVSCCPCSIFLQLSNIEMSDYN